MNRSAFTLVEVSIAIVIMSLLIIVISGGQALLTQSRLSRLSAEINDIKQAIATFGLTYDAIPGDYSNAYSMFGDLGCGDDDSADLSTAEITEACNGNGDYEIENNGIEIAEFDGSSAGFFREEHNVWNHLYYANLMNIPTANNNYFASASFPNVIISYGLQDLTSNPEFKRPSNVLLIGALKTDLLTTDLTQTYVLPASILTPRDAKKLDDKIDDGVAYSGAVQGFSGYESDGSLSLDCASDITDYNADNTTDYDLTHDNKSCVLMIDIYTVH